MGNQKPYGGEFSGKGFKQLLNVGFKNMTMADKAKLLGGVALTGAGLGSMMMGSGAPTYTWDPQRGYVQNQSRSWMPMLATMGGLGLTGWGLKGGYDTLMGRYGKALMASKDPNATWAQQARGARAITSLMDQGLGPEGIRTLKYFKTNYDKYMPSFNWGGGGEGGATAAPATPAVAQNANRGWFGTGYEPRWDPGKLWRWFKNPGRTLGNLGIGTTAALQGTGLKPAWSQGNMLERAQYAKNVWDRG